MVRHEIQPDEYIFIDDVGAGKYETDRPLLSDYLSRQIVRSLVAKGLVNRSATSGESIPKFLKTLNESLKSEESLIGLRAKQKQINEYLLPSLERNSRWRLQRIEPKILPS